MLGNSVNIPFSKPARAMSRRRALLAAAVLATTISAVGPAQADIGYSVLIELDEAVIRVANDGERYTTVLNSSPAITGMMHVEFNAHRDGWIRSWAAWLSIETEVMGKKQFPEHGYSENYGIGNRHKKVKRVLPVSIPRQAYKTYAEQACNKLAKDLQLLQGKTNAEIFAEDRSIAVQVGTERTWDMSGIVEANPPRTEVHDLGDIKPVTILCMKTPPAPPAVTSAALVVQGLDPVSLGRCHMRLNGVIRSNLPYLDVTLRYVDDEGNQSDLKTVTTGSDRWASFEHRYPLSPGQKNTRVRIVGQNPAFTSAWKDFDYECEEGSAIDDFATELPPKAHQLEVGATATEVRLKGHVCPAQAKMIGVFKGRGSASGNAALIANGGVRKLKPYDVEDGETAFIDEEYDLSWGHIQGPLEQEVEFVLRIDNAEGAEVDRLTRTETFRCVDAGMPDQLTSNDPTPPVLTLSVRGGEERLYQGYMCPERVVLKGRVRGQDDFNGRAVFVVRQEQSLAESQSQVKEFNFAVTEDENLTLSFEPEVRWSNVPQNGDAPPKQTMDFSFRVVKTGGVVASVERSLEVSCKGVSIPPVGVYDKPKSYNLSLSELGSKFRNGYVCPTKVGMGGFIQSGSEGFSGSVSYYTGAVLLHSQAVDLGPNTGQGQSVEHVLNWDAGDFPEKEVVYAFKVENQYGIEVGSEEITKRIACEKIETNRDPAVGGLSSGGSNAAHAPTNEAVGQFALQTAPAFAIQAPKGRVRAGRIQLSGGPANAKYDLRFYRGAEGSYRSVRSAQLPRQMTGHAATFNLKALSGSRTWRIEVCPAGSKDKKACKTSDFQLPRLKGAGGVKAPGKPEPTKVFVLPGLGG